MPKVRIGIIGAGWFATTNHIPVLARRTDVELTAVCRLGQTELKNVQQTFGFHFATEDYLELLEQDLDGVVISSPHDMHYVHAAAAFRKGLHVVCEKPMTLDPGQAWDLVRLADKHGCHLLIPYGWNYKPFVAEAREILTSGAIGEIEFVVCRMASPTKAFFAGENGAVPANWTPTLSAPEPDTWQNSRRGGGYGYGQITHVAGLLFWLTELRASRVACVMAAPKSKVDMYDSAIVEFANGATGNVSGAATLPDGSPFQLQLQIFGEAGVLSLDAETGRERVIFARHDRKEKVVPVPYGEGAYSCVDPINNFIDLIQGSGRNCSPGHVAARSVELIHAMYQSARNGGQFADVTSKTTSIHL